MRKAIGRIALLLGVAVVAAMAWYGARSLFEEDDADESGPDVACVAVDSRTQVIAAQRAFVKKYGDARWFGDASVQRTDDGFVLRVTYRNDRPPRDLPSCQAEVRVVAVRGRSSAAG